MDGKKICEVCGYAAANQASLRDHRMFKHVDPSQYPHACQEPNCGKRFFRKYALHQHTLRHRGEKNFECKECGFRLISRNELNNHINNMHEKIKKYSCSMCPEMFTSSKRVRDHILKMHTHSKKYSCRFCRMPFMEHTSCQQHEMTHTGEKPHECPECGKSFRRRHAVKRHRISHYPEGNIPPLPIKPSKSLLCNRSYTDAKEEQEDMQQNHAEDLQNVVSQ